MLSCFPPPPHPRHYRRQVLRSLNSDLKAELAFTTGIILDEPKNYQVWYHRQRVVEWLRDSTEDKVLAQGELAFTAAVLQDDAKNYHAWQHRQWALKVGKVDPW